MFLVPFPPDWKLLPAKRRFPTYNTSKTTVAILCCSYGSYRKSKQRLGSNNNERFAKVTDHLSPQQVEILSRGGGVHYSHVHIVTIYTLLSAVTHLSDNRKDSVIINSSVCKISAWPKKNKPAI